MYAFARIMDPTQGTEAAPRVVRSWTSWTFQSSAQLTAQSIVAPVDANF